MKTRPVTINVTPVDIREGNRGSHCFCPIARAIRRRLHPRFAVFVYDTRVSIVAASSVGMDGSLRPYIKAGARIYAKFTLPVSAIEFICKFDAKNSVSPLRFGYDLPSCTLK